MTTKRFHTREDQREFIRIVASSLAAGGVSPEEALVEASKSWDRKVAAENAIDALLDMEIKRHDS